MKKIVAITLSLIMTISFTALSYARNENSVEPKSTGTAVFYGGKMNDIDTSKDVTTGVSWFKDFGYETYPMILPSFDDILDTFYLGNVVTFSGHGNSSSIWIRPRDRDVTGDNGVGLKASEKDTTSNKSGLPIQFMGVGKRTIPFCNLIIFAGCKTSDPSDPDNITSYTSFYGPKTAIGWDVPVNSSDISIWLGHFYQNLGKGLSVRRAARAADTSLEGMVASDVLEYSIEGQPDQIIPIYTSRTISNKSDSGFSENLTKIDKDINVDFENEDLEELTEYLEDNVAGFDRDTCVVELIHSPYENAETGEKDYTVYYRLKYNDFDTYYGVYVGTEGKDIYYSSTLSDFKMPKAMVLSKEDITNDMIQEAKKEALEADMGNIEDSDVVVEQEVNAKIDETGTPYLHVKTEYEDENEAYFVKNYQYYL